MTPEHDERVAPSDPVAPVLCGAVAVPLALAATVLGYALQRNNGTYEHTARNALVLAMVAALVAVAGPRLSPMRLRESGPPRLPRLRSPQLLLAVAGAALAYDVYALMTSSPGWAPVNTYPNLLLFRVGAGAGALLAATALLERPPLGRVHVPLLLAVHALLGVWIVRAVPLPGIDVYYFHTGAFNALLAGRSPYSITIPNLYGADAGVYYGPGLVVGGRVQFGYPYPPLSLLLALAGHALGDYRYSLVAAVVATAALMAYAHPGRSARVGAVLLLFTPRIFLVYEQGWTEPFVVLAVAATMFCAARRPRMLPIALAALIAVKQYAVLVLPLLWLLLPRRIDGQRPAIVPVVGIAVALAAAVTFPFLLWDPAGFVNAVVLFQLRQPFRGDSLSLLHGVAQHSGIPTTSAVSLVAALGALGVSLWRAPRTLGGFLGSLGFTLLLFFGFAKQAFANYYFAVIGVMLSGVAASGLAATPPGPAIRQAHR
jgi:hypothetical protein